MASAFKKYQKSMAKPHRERSQPEFRQKLGFLEKKQDYKARATNFKNKQAKLLQLRQKAEFKNPDEFYFGMCSAKLVEGEHTALKEGLTKEEIALIETKDLKWLEKRIVMESRKIERLRKSVHIFETSKPVNQHIIFQDEDEEGIELAEQLETTEEMLGRTHNRLTKKQLEDLPQYKKEDYEQVKIERLKTQRELLDRMKRLEKLQNAKNELMRKEESREKKPEIKNAKLAKKYNFNERENSLKMFSKKKSKKKDSVVYSQDEQKRLSELAQAHGLSHAQTPSSFRNKVFGRKESKKSKIEISTPFAFQHVAQAVAGPEDRASIHSSGSNLSHDNSVVHTNKHNESTSSRSSMGDQQAQFVRPTRSASHASNHAHSTPSHLLPQRKDSIGHYSNVPSSYQRQPVPDTWSLASGIRPGNSNQSWKQSISSLHSAPFPSEQPDPYQRCYVKEKVYPKEIPVPPPDSTKLLGPRRKVVLTRRPDTGFGFSLRRSTISERDQTRRTVLFAEPGASGCGLLPGDRLLEINGVDVEHAQQEDAVAKIKAAGNSVTLTVQSIPELTELAVRKPDGIEKCHLLSEKNIAELSFAGSLVERGKPVSFEVLKFSDYIIKAGEKAPSSKFASYQMALDDAVALTASRS
ncbi:Oidioi.mRNA.OKI2018_I69.chr2.g6209.t3.cds [Oikopleura dioica]|uniref:Probable U3 small nucleolar RNA-associated protein 11 n=1 Tax=Oikopleura dioica TaxID=34765 RepID=A0ABN7T8R8_OIKDI|nr:Oidioi.mRNA.OKI2018_I69.chr2.g6209.t3.cds [Oikopleura dioica]